MEEVPKESPRADRCSAQTRYRFDRVARSERLMGFRIVGAV